MTEGFRPLLTVAVGRPGEMFGPYRLEQRIGRGGMGEVFRAFDTVAGRTVALKRLHAGSRDDAELPGAVPPRVRARRAAARPHVIPIHDFGEIDGRLFIDMRLVDGRRPRRRCSSTTGASQPGRAVEIVRQIADALDAAHDDGLVHRDVKPSNVLLTEHRGRDFVYLVDFGIVRAMRRRRAQLADRRPASAIGTLAYMAPELFVGRASWTARVDVYALGCLLFEAVAGRPPFLVRGPGADVRPPQRGPAPALRGRARLAARPRRGPRDGDGQGPERALRHRGRPRRRGRAGRGRRGAGHHPVPPPPARTT